MTTTPAFPIGSTIFGLKAMLPREQQRLGWSHPATTIVLTAPGGRSGDGGTLVAARDPEGNDGGVLCGGDAEGEFMLHAAYDPAHPASAAVDIESEPAGRTIVAVRAFTDAELAERAWSAHDAAVGAVLVLDDGSCLYPTRDPEGNGAGCWFATDRHGAPTYLLPPA